MYKPAFFRLFRVVHAPLFLRSFASDRRHMKDSGGKWIEEPPSHEPIVAEDGTVHNLNEYINISVADAITDVTISSVKDVIFTQKNGVVIKANQLVEFICQLSLE
ncbi:protein N-terminal glutamine amidohydrolase [Vigna umbellata]|uniref:protein N-terminal glutamine amidohydrolase n=1 Tax=Vigna umbellata TaxID=87088 RepID=UPI001F5FDA1E|nr:protein N-terminal glutamine amidohydrolase [Vigna umbellata]